MVPVDEEEPPLAVEIDDVVEHEIPPVGVTVITGYLGAGKSTVKWILNLLLVVITFYNRLLIIDVLLTKNLIGQIELIEINSVLPSRLYNVYTQKLLFWKKKKKKNCLYYINYAKLL